MDGANSFHSGCKAYISPLTSWLLKTCTYIVHVSWNDLQSNPFSGVWQGLLEVLRRMLIIPLLDANKTQIYEWLSCWVGQTQHFEHESLNYLFATRKKGDVFSFFLFFTSFFALVWIKRAAPPSPLSWREKGKSRGSQSSYLITSTPLLSIFCPLSFYPKLISGSSAFGFFFTSLLYMPPNITVLKQQVNEQCKWHEGQVSEKTYRNRDVDKIQWMHAMMNFSGPSFRPTPLHILYLEHLCLTIGSHLIIPSQEGLPDWSSWTKL